MPRSGVLTWMFPLLLMLLETGVASGQATATGSGQDYPARPIRIITSGLGGGNDFAARLIAHGLTTSFAQQVIVDNRGSSVVPGEIVSKAPPDGHTLLMGTASLWTGSLLQKVPYDPVKDFAPVTLALSFPTILAMNASVAANSVRELVALAKARPAQLNYIMTTTGGSAHLAAELFKAMAGVNMTPVPYKNAGTAIIDMIGGQVQLFFSAAGPVMPHVKAGKLKALAVTSPRPSALFPELPTVATTVPGYEVVGVYCIFAPPRTPLAIINRLNREIVRVLSTADAREKFFNIGLEVVGSSPEELAATRTSDLARMSKVIKDAGIRAE